MEFGAGHARGFPGSFPGAGAGPGRDAAAGDVPMAAALGAAPTALQALESAVALPGVFTPQELARTLRRHGGDVMRAALQLREKHALRARLGLSELHVGLPALQAELRKGYVHVLEDASDARGCPLVLLQPRHFRPRFSSDALQRQGVGAADGSSSLEDARRLCVYVLDLAVEAMEEQGAPGVAFLVDLAGCALANLEARVVPELLLLAKQWYPETLAQVLVVNGSAVARALALLVAQVASERTRRRVRVLSDARELLTAIPAASLPEMYGGRYRLWTPARWLARQAEIEGVALDARDRPATHEERAVAGADARQLNGMQYAGCSAAAAARMRGSELRGPLLRAKGDTGAWARLHAVLRPEALLLYDSAAADRPAVIVPVNADARVETARTADAHRGAAAFRVLVPGVSGGHLLAAGSEPERASWLQELQLAIDADAERRARDKREEDRRAAEERAFARLDMISFDDAPAAPAPPPPPPAAMPMAPAMAGMPGMSAFAGPLAPFQPPGMAPPPAMNAVMGMMQQQQQQQQLNGPAPWGFPATGPSALGMFNGAQGGFRG